MTLRKKRKKDIFNTPTGRVFDFFNFIIMGLFAFITLAPFLYVFAGSFATELEITTRSFFLIPRNITTEAYRFIFVTGTVIDSMIRTAGVTVVGTLIQLFFTFTFAYPLSRKNLRGRSLIMKLVLFTMLFSGGMIPTFQVVRSLGLLNTYWALILPIAISPFNLIVIINNFKRFPVELIEAAHIDGCSEMKTFLKIVLPLSKPIIATFALFYAVGLWNDFFSAFIYITDASMWTVQVVLRQVVTLSATTMDTVVEGILEVPQTAVRFATIIVATLPILCVYPFLQKHFAKGMMVGSIKG